MGCAAIQVLPARTAPERVRPQLSLPEVPPDPGRGRVVIATTDGPMDVTARYVEPFSGAATGGSTSGPLCRTPCTRDLPFGRYTLYLSGLESDKGRGDAVDLEVRQGLNFFLRAPGKYETPESWPSGSVMLVVGGSLLMVVGLAVVLSNAENSATLGGGVATMVGGGVLTLLGASQAQPRAIQQEGATTEWNEPIAAAAVTTEQVVIQESDP